MTKPFSALLVAVLCASFGPMAAAQTTSDAARPMPGWVYEIGAPASDIDPVVIERSLSMALWLGVLGQEVRPYRVALAGAGYAALLLEPVPEGWVIIRRCMEWDVPTRERPEDRCLVYEMRELTGDPYTIGWD